MCGSSIFHWSICSSPAVPLATLIYQTKRKKHRKGNNEETYQMHAVQIFAEMLGQVYHRNLCADLRMFQEVALTRSLLADRDQAFVLHSRHAVFYLFYPTFPNTYLRDIAMYGANYRQQVPDPQHIIIKQSAPFRMRYPKQQASFFRLFANVLYYLVSGNSSVGYMAKDEK